MQVRRTLIPFFVFALFGAPLFTRDAEAELQRHAAKDGCVSVSPFKPSRAPAGRKIASIEEPGETMSFRIRTAMYLRQGERRAPAKVAPRGTELRLSPSFLREYSVEDPSDVIRNPERYGLKKKRIYVPSTRRYEHHYLYPVEYETKRGETVTGYMALHFAERIRKIRHPAPVVKRVTASSSPALECSAELAESGLRAQTAEDLRNIASRIEADQEDVRNLWEEYEDFARRFYRNHGHKAHKGMDPDWAARNLRAQYLKDLIEEFGQEKASLMLAAVTAWGEAGRRPDKMEQLADLAAVLKVIENRASTKFAANRGAESLLASLGIPKSKQNERLKAVLAHLQFSVWNLHNLPKKNEVNPSLIQILGFNPDSKYRASPEKMRLAFEAQEKMGRGSIRFVGAFGHPNVRHYLANYFESRTSWAAKNPHKKITEPVVQIADDDGDVHDVNLNSFKTPKHLFYGGLR